MLESTHIKENTLWLILWIFLFCLIICHLQQVNKYIFHCEQLKTTFWNDSVLEFYSVQVITKGNHKYITFESAKCFQVKNCQYQHHFLSSILSLLCRREEERTDHEGGSGCPRKWMAVILPWLVKVSVILRGIICRGWCNRNSYSQINLSFIFYREG